MIHHNHHCQILVICTSNGIRHQCSLLAKELVIIPVVTAKCLFEMAQRWVGWGGGGILDVIWQYLFL